MKRAVRTFVQEKFPELWLQWHFLRRPKSAEVELSLLDRVVRSDSVSIDVGANLGLYTRELAHLSRFVHAFEPSHKVADILRRTSARNVVVHETALSDRCGVATLQIPLTREGSVHGLASIESQAASRASKIESLTVLVSRLDSAVQSDVGFIKIDVEGHELCVLNGAERILEHCQPVFLVEAEDRHRVDATRSVFEFFRARRYSGFFIKGHEVRSVEEFSVDALQNPASLLSDGGRKENCFYVNNFFFFPETIDGRNILQGV
jgi:FkbM family methyltransferase